MRTRLTPTRRAIVALGKLPKPGRVKTRLGRHLGHERAAGLYRAFLGDVLDLVAAEAELVDAEAWFDCQLDPDERVADAEALCPPSVRAVRQVDGDLGAKLRAARAMTGARHVLLIGSDAPMMPGERLYEAFQRLDAGADAVVGPTADGGYDLIGLSGDHPCLFADIPWSTPEVIAATRRAALLHGLELAELAEGYDLDEPDDLRRAYVELGAGPQAPRTRAALRQLFDPLAGDGSSV